GSGQLTPGPSAGGGNQYGCCGAPAARAPCVPSPAEPPGAARPAPPPPPQPLSPPPRSHPPLARGFPAPPQHPALPLPSDRLPSPHARAGARRAGSRPRAGAPAGPRFGAVAPGPAWGPPPFGHAGERALDRCLAGVGGFDHNAQTLRTVTALERRYAAFDGLNLSWEMLEGLIKHNGPLTLADGTPIGRYRERGVPQAIAD